MDISRISEMESCFNECASAAAGLKAQLDRMEGVREQMIRLYRYYGSAEWYDDREGDLPEGMQAGVLSEDAVYDQIAEVRDAAFRMLEIAADILKNRL